jgi:hypothetical protein
MILIGETFSLVGTIMIAFTAITVHIRFRKEHRVNDKVFDEMRKEQFIGVFGIILIVIGYLLKIPYLV